MQKLATIVARARANIDAPNHTDRPDTKFRCIFNLACFLVDVVCAIFSPSFSSSQFFTLDLSVRISASFIHHSLLLFPLSYSFFFLLLFSHFDLVFPISVFHPHITFGFCLCPILFCSCLKSQCFRARTRDYLTHFRSVCFSLSFFLSLTVIKFCLCFCIFPISFYFSILMLIWPHLIYTQRVHGVSTNDDRERQWPIFLSFLLSCFFASFVLSLAIKCIINSRPCTNQSVKFSSCIILVLCITTGARFCDTLSENERT